MTLHTSPTLRQVPITPPAMTAPGAMQWIYARQAEGMSLESLLTLLCNAGWDERLVRRVLGLPLAPPDTISHSFRA